MSYDIFYQTTSDFTKIKMHTSIHQFFFQQYIPFAVNINFTIIKD